MPIPSTAKVVNKLNNNQNGYHHQQQQQPQNGFMNQLNMKQNGYHGYHIEAQNCHQNVHQQQMNEEERIEIINQRMDMLYQLESKPQIHRSNDEENRINNLKTEIEFDKRVIQMSQNDQETEEFSPVRQQKQSTVDSSVEIHTEIEVNNTNTQLTRPKKNVQFVQEAEIMSPKFSSPPSSQMSSSSNLKSSPPDHNDFITTTPPNNNSHRIILGENNSDMGLKFEDNEDDYNNHLSNTPCVIGANEIYVDQRLKLKQEKEQLKANIAAVEGEKLSFKDKMKLFAKQAGQNDIYDSENKFKVSKKQREIESKFQTKA